MEKMEGLEFPLVPRIMSGDRVVVACICRYVGMEAHNRTRNSDLIAIP